MKRSAFVVVFASIGALVGGVLAVSERASPGPGSDERRIRYVVVPHPDDETQSWTLIGGDPAIYPVFLLLTRGEGTRNCDEARWHAALQPGERPPTPEPQAPGTTECAQARVDSWHWLLDAVTRFDPHLGEVRSVGARQITACEECSARTYDLYVGEGSARLVFDFGDGDLQAAEVEAAIGEARRLRDRGAFRYREEHGVVGAGYHSVAEGCAFYGHPDHEVMHTVLRETDFGVPGAQWTRTSHCDSPDVVLELPVEVFEGLYAAGDDIDTLGLVQAAYGWLQTTYWPWGVDDRVAPGRSAHPFDPDGTPFFTQLQPHHAWHTE